MKIFKFSHFFILCALFLFGSCNHAEDSTSDLALIGNDKNNAFNQALKFKKLDNPQNDGPGGGTCTETWITSTTESWCSIESDDYDDCCCIRINLFTNSVIVAFKYDISEAVYTEVYYVMDWYSSSSSAHEHWEDLIESSEGASGGGCEFASGDGSLTDFLYPLCPGTVTLTVGIRYKTSNNGPFCICNSVYREFEWVGFMFAIDINQIS